MAKTAPKKKGSQSVHSRAAKRASSPSIDTDKSLKNAKPPTESTKHRPSVLAIHQGAGVTKKSKNGRKSVLSAKAKRRQERGLDRAEAVMDKKEKKVEKSKGRAKVVQERSKAWEELNRKMLAKKAQEEAAGLEDDNWVNETAEDEIQGNIPASNLQNEEQDARRLKITSLDTEMTLGVEGLGQQTVDAEEEIL